MPVTDLDPRYIPVIDAFTDWSKDHSKIQASFISGSTAQGTADHFSDLDFTIIAVEDDVERLLEDGEALIEEIEPVVLRRKLAYPRAIVLSMVTENWLRVDMLIADAGSGVLSQPLIPIYDPIGLLSPHEETPVPEADAETLQHDIEEFFRMLGLAVVGMGRNEVHSSHDGVNIQREALIRLFLMEPPATRRPSAKKLLPVLTVEQQDLLKSIPPISDNRASLIEANAAISRIYLARARKLCADVGGTWPEALESATAKYLSTNAELASADFGLS